MLSPIGTQAYPYLHVSLPKFGEREGLRAVPDISVTFATSTSDLSNLSNTTRPCSSFSSEMRFSCEIILLIAGLLGKEALALPTKAIGEPGHII